MDFSLKNPTDLNIDVDRIENIPENRPDAGKRQATTEI